MGLGDDIMLTAKARSLYKETGQKMYPTDRGKLEWSIIFDNSPYFTKNKEDGIPFEVRPRPYSDGFYRDGIGTYHKLKRSINNPGTLHFTEEELKKADDVVPFSRYCTIEPNYKEAVYADNKAWGFHKWQFLVDANPDIGWVQCYKEGDSILQGVHPVQEDVRIAFAVISRAVFHVGTEGGTIHAATACGVPAIAIFGGLSAPWATGYPDNENMYVDHTESPCGRQYSCEHCKYCMHAISPIEVDCKVKELKERYYG